MDRYDGQKREYLRRGMTHRKIAFALSVLLVCVNIGLSQCTITAMAEEPVFQSVSSTSGNDVSDNSVDPSVSDNDPSETSDPESLSEPSVSDNSEEEKIPAEEEENSDPEEPEEETPEEEIVEDVPMEEPTPVEPEQVANTEYEAVAYQEIAEYFLEPKITQVDRDAEYEDGIYYANPNSCYYIFVENDVNYLVCRYDGGQQYIEIRDGVGTWEIPADYSGQVSFGYEGTEGTYRELFTDIIFHDTTAPSVVLGMDDSYQSRLRIEISETGNAKSGIGEVSCMVDGELAELENLTTIQSSVWRGENVSLMSLATYRDAAGVHEITLTVTDKCGNVSETTETFEILTNGMISVTLPGSFIIPMIYDANNGSYLLMENELKVVNNGDAPLDVKITNVTVSVDKTLPTNWTGPVTSEALAAAARKTIDTTLNIETAHEGRISSHLQEGLNKSNLSFTLDAKQDGETGNSAIIQFTGNSGSGDPGLWEDGDFMVHMTFLFSIHLEPEDAADTSYEDRSSNASLQDAGLSAVPSEPEAILASESIPESDVPLAAAPADNTENGRSDQDPPPDGISAPQKAPSEAQ